MDTIIIPITDFIRKAGLYSERLPKLEKIILTKEGRPFAEVKATPQEKNRKLLSFFGAWKGTELDSDKFWKDILKRKNRKKIITV